MNQTIMTGNLTADIETRDIKASTGDQHLSKFTLACNEGERVVFIPVEAWNMPHLAEYLHKGSKALLSGGLKQEHWETEEGDKRSRIVLTAYKVEFLDPAPAPAPAPAPGYRPGDRPGDRPGRSAAQPVRSKTTGGNNKNFGRRHAA